MLKEKRYTLSELNAVLAESTKQEFKPRIGDGTNKVNNENKKNNEEAVNDIVKETGKYNPKTTEKRTANDENTRDMNGKTTDYRFVNDPGDEWKERNKALVHGFASKDNEENSDAPESGADFEGNKKIYDDFKKLSDEREEDREAGKAAGLKTREEIKKSKNKADAIKSKTGYVGESKNMKRLYFKNTQFLSESHMINKIPDDYKYDGNKFIMKDSLGTEYIVECSIDSEYNNVEFNVINKYNKQELKEQLDRMKSLYNYDRSDNSKEKVMESRNAGTSSFAEDLERVRNLNK